MRKLFINEYEQDYILSCPSYIERRSGLPLSIGDQLYIAVLPTRDVIAQARIANIYHFGNERIFRLENIEIIS
jgi:hypothetical protein